MRVRQVSLAAISAGLVLAGCTETGGSSTTQTQTAYESVENNIVTAAAAGNDEALTVMRTNRQGLQDMATQDCPQALGTLQELDCQYDATGAAYFLSYSSTFDAEPTAVDGFDPFDAAGKRAAATATSCGTDAKDEGRCAIAAEVALLTPVLAELRDVRIAAKTTEIRSVESWDALKDGLFRASKTVEDSWSTKADLPDTAFIQDGRKALGCGLIDSLNTIIDSREANVFDADGNKQLSDAQNEAAGNFFAQRDRLALALSAAIVPDAEGDENEKRKALTRACIPDEAATP